MQVFSTKPHGAAILSDSHLRSPLRGWMWVAPLCLLAAAAGSGCVTGPERLQQSTFEQAAAAEIVESLAARSAEIGSLQATGEALLESPQFEAVKRFYGRVSFRKPDKLHLSGVHRATGVVVARLTSSGEDYVLEFPREPDQTVFKFGELASENHLFGLSPAAAVTEMLFPEEWADLAPEALRITAVDEAAGTVEAEIREDGVISRKLLLQGRPWAVLQTDRYEDGLLAVRVSYSDYQVVNGVPLPGSIHAVFVEEKTVLDLELRNPVLNALTGEEELFDVRARMRELGLLSR
jgi:hypothetical protein